MTAVAATVFLTANSTLNRGQRIPSPFTLIPAAHRPPEPFSPVGQDFTLLVGGTRHTVLRPHDGVAAALAPAAAPHGFTATEFTAKVASMSGQDGYTIRGVYDLRKVRGKNVAVMPGTTRRYHIPAEAARTIAAMLAHRDQVIAPILVGGRSPRRGRRRTHWTADDRRYETLRIGIQDLSHGLGIIPTTAAA